jgi:hypothetical protein
MYEIFVYVCMSECMSEKVVRYMYLCVFMIYLCWWVWMYAIYACMLCMFWSASIYKRMYVHAILYVVYMQVVFSYVRVCMCTLVFVSIYLLMDVCVHVCFHFVWSSIYVIICCAHMHACASVCIHLYLCMFLYVCRIYVRMCFCT